MFLTPLPPNPLERMSSPPPPHLCIEPTDYTDPYSPILMSNSPIEWQPLEEDPPSSYSIYTDATMQDLISNDPLTDKQLAVTDKSFIPKIFVESCE